MNKKNSIEFFGPLCEVTLGVFRLKLGEVAAISFSLSHLNHSNYCVWIRRYVDQSSGFPGGNNRDTKEKLFMENVRSLCCYIVHLCDTSITETLIARTRS